MRTLYHFEMSPFSRRARLALAHKGLVADLREARRDPKFLEEARRLSPLRTFPVFVDEDGTVIPDSNALAHYLDRAYPSSPLWPSAKADAAQALVVTTLVDVALTSLVDVGTRYFALRSHESFGAVSKEMVDRAQDALHALEGIVARLQGETFAGGYGAADIWLYTLVAWLRRLPERAPTAPLVAQIMTLGWTLPPSLALWADRHASRPEIVALDA